MDMLPEGFEFHNGNGNLCLIGSFDKETETFRPEKAQAVDSGIDFYASQTMQAPDGRRIMVAWMQNPDCCSYRGSALPWYGQMTIPRELEIRDGRLWQRPVRELESLRSGHVSVQGITFSGELRLAGVSGRRLDLEVTVRVTDPLNPYHKFILRFAKNDRYYTQLSFRPRENILKLDRKFSGTRRAVINQRRCLIRRPMTELKLRVILDRYSVEVFINDGEQVMTALLYTDQDARDIMFYADGEACIDVDKYDLID
jgi:beta-fructofuranosidase